MKKKTTQNNPVNIISVIFNSVKSLFIEPTPAPEPQIKRGFTRADGMMYWGKYIYKGKVKEVWVTRFVFDRRLAQKKAWLADNKGYHKKWYKKNKDKMRKYQRKYQRKYRKANAEKLREYYRKYHRNRKEAMALKMAA
jgi:hypothetical protein